MMSASGEKRVVQWVRLHLPAGKRAVQLKAMTVGARSSVLRSFLPVASQAKMMRGRSGWLGVSNASSNMLLCESARLTVPFTDFLQSCWMSGKEGLVRVNKKEPRGKNQKGGCGVNLVDTLSGRYLSPLGKKERREGGKIKREFNVETRREDSVSAEADRL